MRIAKELYLWCYIGESYVQKWMKVGWWSWCPFNIAKKAVRYHYQSTNPRTKLCSLATPKESNPLLLEPFYLLARVTQQLRHNHNRRIGLNSLGSAPLSPVREREKKNRERRHFVFYWIVIELTWLKNHCRYQKIDHLPSLLESQYTVFC